MVNYKLMLPEKWLTSPEEWVENWRTEIHTSCCTPNRPFYELEEMLTDAVLEAHLQELKRAAMTTKQYAYAAAAADAIHALAAELAKLKKINDE